MVYRQPSRSKAKQGQKKTGNDRRKSENKNPKTKPRTTIDPFEQIKKY